MDEGTLEYGGFEALTFDCYGTLIDWETGLLAAFTPILAAHGVVADRDAILERFAIHEASAESPPYRRYRDVLASALRGVGADVGFEPSDAQAAAFAGSVPDWPAFPDTAAALERLKRRFRLGIITNCDDDLFAGSLPKLGVDLDWVVTAEQVGSYKPDRRNFEVAFERLALPRERILHVAQSLFHDHEPAKRLDLRTVWIDRRRGRAGGGATPPADARPDATFGDLASFAEAATG